MPSTFESFGVKFLYPDNWKTIDRDEDEGGDGVTLELPSGGFFTLEKELQGQIAEEIIEDVADSISEDYDEVEREDAQLEGATAGERCVNFRFYYLDLMIVSRLVITSAQGIPVVIQMQAESRDFDENELVFAAILKQIRG
ncbi:MAG: hypothetical protein ACR2NZ_24430 [Rubripirellula sp.]